ncbi:lysylphosphatidylglycerol synthase transmembrane domain-containing protein [Pseudohaliea rubra]|uniref:Dolichol-P-glucose synthetase-like protein n=1 Tax=Pseudohaliea rubra DSM 19751 TaxID=1265313 RepID=A0A095VS76_9GAMM|nr:lysylphosphatidylglycerol synthase transmembrane domain-containing protein [Pseudohaliea rubra]KGE04220.1 dolichol-P-glucose synthetase-like protein [Pseudohaliea rubra DSM 19751]
MALDRRLVRTLQLVATAACLALLWRAADGGTALRHLAAANPAWMAAAFAALTLQTVLSALRWRLTAARLGIALERRAALAEYYLAQLLNQALPGGVLGDAGRAVRARAPAGLVVSGQAVVFERLTGQIALFAVFAGGVVVTQVVPGGFDGPSWLLAPAALVVVAGAALLLWLAASPLPGTAPLGSGAAFRHAVASPDVRVRQAWLSLGTALCNIAAFAFCAAAIGLTLSPAAAQVLVPLILLSMLIPITISGWGLREGAAVALLPLAGATGAEGLAASVAFGFTMMAAALPGLAALALATAPDPVES